MTKPLDLPLFDVPDTIARESMPDLLRYWYLGTRARRHMMLRRFSEVDAELAPVPGARILDIGSAWGFNVMALDRLGFDAVGVDLVVDQFEVGRRIASHNDAEFRAIGATAAGLPFPDATFDAVTMVETFEHIFTQDRPAAVGAGWSCRRQTTRAS
jgi:2-polyprenyl-3-methyl-5-hydroxy-6-metoxy-1,4-benzoquinol methylase